MDKQMVLDVLPGSAKTVFVRMYHECLERLVV